MTEISFHGFRERYLDTFCAGVWLHSAWQQLHGTRKENARLMLDDAIRKAAPYKRTCLFFGDRTANYYNCAHPIDVMLLMKELEGTTISVMGVGLWADGISPPVCTMASNGVMVYEVGTINVHIEQVLITKPWRNINSNNMVQACMAVINYRAYRQEATNIHKVRAVRGESGSWMPSTIRVNDKGVAIDE